MLSSFQKLKSINTINKPIKNQTTLMWYQKGEYVSLTTLECLRFYKKDFDILEYEQYMPIL
jgi:hypothetical protein